MRRVWVLARKYVMRWVWGGLMLALTNLAAMAIPQLFRVGIDGLHDGASLDLLLQVAEVLVLLAAGGAVFRTLSRLHLFYAARDVELDMRSAFFRHLTRLEPAFFATHPVGDLMSRATSDLTQVRLMLGPGFLNVINAAVAYAIAVPLMLMLSVKLTLLVLIVYPLGFLLMRHLGRRVFLQTVAQQQTLGRISDVVQETLAGAQVVRAFTLEPERRRALDQLSQRYFEQGMKLVGTRAIMGRLVLAIANIGVLLAVVFGARDALQGHISPGELVALIEYMALLAWPTFALGWVISMWQRGRAALLRLDEVMSVVPSTASGPQQPAVLLPSFELKGLSVSLGGRQVLDEVSVQVRPGAVLGVVGPIGAGKSTLLAALVRLVDVEAGRVFVGGHDATALDLGVLRAAFGYVPQSHTLFSRRLRDNVAFGRPVATDEEVLQALRDAAFEADLRALPQGLDTPIGERGITLSGGQKQRVAIARALLLDPPILLLDDALSSVDAATEADLLSRLLERRRDRTTVIVAHRVSAVAHAGEIIVLDAGRVVQRGTHQGLLKEPGFYADVARHQELEAAAKQPELESA